MILGADVGGTFTDLVVVDDGEVSTAKVPTTRTQSDGIASGAKALVGERQATAFLHGTTVATNALLERKGARTALITDARFEDIIEIGRQDRPSLYDSFSDRPQPLVPRSDRIGVGSDVAGFDALPTGIESLAIATVSGHDHPDRELEIEHRARALGFHGPVSRSSTVAPEFREYERTSTTVLNAYLVPATAHYLETLDEAMIGSGLVGHVSVMMSSGGLTSIEEAAHNPATILLSGPAGGVIATAAFAGRHGHRRVVSFDMGGTSTDVCRIEDGGFDVSYERSVDGYVCRLPSAGVHTVGAGGGSIARIDPGGSLRVGPTSAGAVPGPACYGLGGTHATVSDANVVLGRIAPDAALGGSLRVDRSLAVEALTPLSLALGMTVEEAALGVVAIAEEVMAQAIRRVSVEQGSDPRGAFLYAFGGAGGLHASALARSLGMEGVVVPPHGGVFSALGLLLAPPRSDVAVSVLGSEFTIETVTDAFDRVSDRARSTLEAAGHRVARIESVVDVRYRGQSHEIGVPFAKGDSIEGIVGAFHEAHRRRNGFIRPDDPVEVVTVRAAAVGTPALSIDQLAVEPSGAETTGDTRRVIFAEGSVDAAVVHRDSLAAGATVSGPAIVEEDEATTVLAPGETAVVLESGAMEVTW